MPSFSLALRSASVIAIQACMRGLVLLPVNTARKVLGLAVMEFLRGNGWGAVSSPCGEGQPDVSSIWARTISRFPNNFCRPKFAASPQAAPPAACVRGATPLGQIFRVMGNSEFRLGSYLFRSNLPNYSG